MFSGLVVILDSKMLESSLQRLGSHENGRVVRESIALGEERKSKQETSIKWEAVVQAIIIETKSCT